MRNVVPQPSIDWNDLRGMLVSASLRNRITLWKMTVSLSFIVIVKNVMRKTILIYQIKAKKQWLPYNPYPTCDKHIDNLLLSFYCWTILYYYYSRCKVKYLNVCSMILMHFMWHIFTNCHQRTHHRYLYKLQ